MIGPTYYGVRNAAKVASVTETVTTYTKITPTKETNLDKLSINIFPNPSSDLLAIQIDDLVKEDYAIELYDATGKLVQSAKINTGSTIAYFDTQTLYAGTYLVKISNGSAQTTRKVVLQKK